MVGSLIKECNPPTEGIGRDEGLGVRSRVAQNYYAQQKGGKHMESKKHMHKY